MLYDFTARMHEDDIVYIHQRAQRAGIALKTKYSPLVDIYSNDKWQANRATTIEEEKRALCKQQFYYLNYFHGEYIHSLHNLIHSGSLAMKIQLQWPRLTRGDCRNIT